MNVEVSQFYPDDPASVVSVKAQPIIAEKLCAKADLNDFKTAQRYRLTDVPTGRAIPNGDAATWTTADLARGIPLSIPPQERILLRLDAVP